jgi:hypothetical protein
MSPSFKLMIPLLLAAAPAAAQDAQAPAPAPPKSTPSVAPEDVAPPKSGPVTRQSAHRESPLLDFDYVWPEAVAGDSELIAHFDADLSKSYDEATNNARENKTAVQNFPGAFHQNLFDRTWTLEGQTPRFYSLVSNTDTFTGGAHPNHNSSALLWDRNAHKAVELADLFESSSAFEAAVRPQFCKLLDAERLKRRQGDKLDGEFSECPKFSDLTIAPAAKSGEAFTTIRLIADPYVAGPYAEGDYEIDVPVTPSLATAVKAEFKSDFKAQ